MTADYWLECIWEAFEDAGIEATDEQVINVAGWAESAHENYGQAHGHDVAHRGPDPEITRLRRELQAERDKVPCRECNCTGTLRSNGPVHSSESTCWRCRGEGKHAP